MRQLILYIIFLMSMVFTGYGEVSAASTSFAHQDSFLQNSFLQDSLASETTQSKKDGLAKVEHKQDQHEAQLEDASSLAYRVCSNRPQRLLPNGNIHVSGQSASRLLFYRIRFLSSLLSAVLGGYEPFRQESAPIHFDVASKYYVICLRHLRC